MPKQVNLLSPDAEQLQYCLERSILPHLFKGHIDHDCEECGFSVYMAVHREGWPRLEEDEVL